MSVPVSPKRSALLAAARERILVLRVQCSLLPRVGRLETIQLLTQLAEFVGKLGNVGVLSLGLFALR